MEKVREIVSLALAEESKKDKVRQPLNELKIKNNELKGKEESLELIKEEINIKKITFDEELSQEIEITKKSRQRLKKKEYPGMFKANQIIRKKNVYQLMMRYWFVSRREFINTIIEKTKNR